VLSLNYVILPDDLKTITSFPTFKAHLKLYLQSAD